MDVRKWAFQCTGKHRAAGMRKFQAGCGRRSSDCTEIDGRAGEAARSLGNPDKRLRAVLHAILAWRDESGETLGRRLL